ncbi:MAG: hypothetical protein ACYC4U_25050 [Pirellulaceae bacterium]
MRCERGRHTITAAVALCLLGGGSSDLIAPVLAQDNGANAVGFVNPGVYRATVREQIYEWIPTEDVSLDIRPDGKVRIVAPASKRSFDGQTDCRRFLYDHLHRQLAPEEEDALFGEGLSLPPGNYGFAIQWVNAGSYDEVRAEPWNLTSNPETYQTNSAQLDYFYLSVVPRQPATSAGEIRELTLPRDLQRVSWLPHYQVLPDDLHLPADKGFGITRLLWDVPLEQIYRKVTHIQYCYEELDQVPAAKKWKTKQALDHSGQLASDAWLIANQPMDRDFITAAEMDENFGSRGVRDHVERAQRVLEGIYRRMESELGVTSPKQTRLYDDYFGALAGFDNNASFLWWFDAARFTEGLASETMARRMMRDGQWIEESRYFSTGAYQYRNWLEGGYLDSYPVCPEGVRIYNEIYNYERKFMAIPDRKVLKFSWSNAEGVNSTMYRHGVKSRLHFTNGDIIRTDVVAWPFHMMLTESFWALLLSNDFVLWHSNLRLVQDPLAFRDSGAAGAGKTRWQPVGGQAVEYDPNDPTQPQRKASPQGQFPNNPHLGESGAFAGAWLVSQITAVNDRTSRSIAYCPFEYRVNSGRVETGYADSNMPKKGKRGDAQLSHAGVANYGQANIVASFVARKPICVYTEGKDGAALIFHNVYAHLTDRTSVTALTESGQRSFTVQGNDLHVFLLD